LEVHDPMEGHRLIRLSENDNVRVIGEALEADDCVTIGGESVTVCGRFALGHKLASRPIAEGEVITKYGFPIGVTTEEIPLGGHVRVHNMRSNYTPTHVVAED